MLIRWVPANVTYVGFFSNFLLMASFLGIGLGIILGRGGRRLPILPFAVLLLAVVWLVYNFQLNVKAGSSNELFFGLAESHSADINFLALPLVVVLVTGLLATLALPLGPLLRSMPPLKAYAIDIIGSMAGIAAFTLLSAGGTDPLVWFGVACVLVLLLELGGGLTIWSGVGALALAGVMLLVFNQATGPQGQLDTWSPYYRITTLKYTDDPSKLKDYPTSLNVNGIPHQTMHAVEGYKEPFYDQIYKWFPGKTYQNVLIVGAGSGTDVANALAHGAQHIDAVEIDPAIQQIGIDQHPDHPYQDPRVTRYINDGRAFLRSTDKKYDLILFALPDSLTLVSTTANLRLESFLFTQQAFESARDHLTDDGTFVLYNYYRQDWLVTKIANMLKVAFGTTPLLHTFQQVSATLADGPAVAALPNGQPPGDITEAIPSVGEPTPKVATDDWPFLYLRTPFIADYYLVAIGAGAADGVPAGGRCGQDLGHQPAPLQPPLLRAGRGLPAARDARPGQLQPAVRDDLAGQRADLLRHPLQRAVSHRGQLAIPHPPAHALLRGPLRGSRHRLPGAARVAAHRPAVAALRAGRGAGLRAGVPRQPRLQLLVP